MKPTRLRDLAQLIGYKKEGTTIVTSVAIDSRKIEKGALFFALPGARVDGHHFLQMAKEAGAVAAVVQQDYRGESYGLDLITVPDVLAALQEMGRKTLQARNAKVVAITGSLGKTTTKEFTASLLSTTYRVAKTPLSYNTQSTLPLSILMSEGDEEIYVLEMGMTHAGDLKKLIAIAPPDIAVITTVALQHAVNFSEGLRGISQEKGSIFSHPKTTLGVLHRDIEHYDEIESIGAFPKISFSLSDKRAAYILREPAVIYSKQEKISIPLTLPLRPHYQNFLAACVVARELGVSWEKIQEIAPTLKLPPQRFEFVEKEGIVFINDAYNANPDAIKAALEHLPEPKKGGRKIAVLTEMNALGAHAEEGHSFVATVALKHVDLLLCLGGNCEVMRTIWKKNNKSVLLCENKEHLFQALKQSAKPGDVVLLKGARAYALEDLLAKF